METSARYLRAARQRARQAGSLTADAPGKWVRRVIFGVFVPSLALVTLVRGAVEVGPAYAAAHGHGTLGTFVAVRTDTCEKPPACSWYGDLVSADGRDVRVNVRLEGAWTHVSPGTAIPALDTGDPFSVFSRTGSTRWTRTSRSSLSARWSSSRGSGSHCAAAAARQRAGDPAQAP